jgi:hypothetical protein
MQNPIENEGFWIVRVNYRLLGEQTTLPRCTDCAIDTSNWFASETGKTCQQDRSGQGYWVGLK